MADDKPLLPAGASDVPPPPSDAFAPAPPPPPIAPVPPGAIAATPMNVPPIPLEAPPSPRRASLLATVGAPKKDTEVKDTFRELIETVVFVVVLVLMLKTFLAEAFVIPTGSMANTLLGYHHKVPCKQCGYVNWVNATAEAEPPAGAKVEIRVERCQCINCKFINELPKPDRARGGPQQ